MIKMFFFQSVLQETENHLIKNNSTLGAPYISELIDFSIFFLQNTKTLACEK